MSDDAVLDLYNAGAGQLLDAADQTDLLHWWGFNGDLITDEFGSLDLTNVNTVLQTDGLVTG